MCRTVWMWLLVLAVLPLFCESQDERKNLDCCTKSKRRRVGHIKDCHEQVPRDDCNFHSFVVLSQSGKQYCVKPKTLWLKRLIKKGDVKCPVIETTPRPELNQPKCIFEEVMPELCDLLYPTTTLPKPEPTTLPKPEPTTLPKPEPTTLPKPEPTTLPKPEPTTLPKPEPTTLPEPYPYRPEPYPDQPKPEPTTLPKPEPTTLPEPEPTTQPECIFKDVLPQLCDLTES